MDTPGVGEFGPDLEKIFKYSQTATGIIYVLNSSPTVDSHKVSLSDRRCGFLDLVPARLGQRCEQWSEMCTMVRDVNNGLISLVKEEFRLLTL